MSSFPLTSVLLFFLVSFHVCAEAGGLVINLAPHLCSRPVALSGWKARSSLSLLVSKQERQSYLTLLSYYSTPEVAAAVKEAELFYKPKPAPQPAQAEAQAQAAPADSQPAQMDSVPEAASSEAKEPSSK